MKSLTYIVDASSNKCVNSAGFSEVFELVEPSCGVDCLPAPRCVALSAPHSLCVCVCVACIFKCNASKCSVVVQRAVHTCEWGKRIRIRIHVWMQVSVSASVVSADCEWIAEMGILRLHCDLEHAANWLSLFGLGFGLGLFRLLHSMAAQVVCPPWRMSNRLMLASDILLSNQWQRKQASSKAPNKCASPLICHAHFAWKKRHEVATNTHTHTYTQSMWGRVYWKRAGATWPYLWSRLQLQLQLRHQLQLLWPPAAAWCAHFSINCLVGCMQAVPALPPTHRHQQQPQQQQQQHEVILQLSVIYKWGVQQCARSPFASLGVALLCILLLSKCK